MSRDQDFLSRPAVLVMLLIVAATLAFGMLFLSAAESVTTPDGAVEWHEESLLRAVVKLLCLAYQAPTVFAGDVKYYILGLGTALALLTVGASLLFGAAEGINRDGAPGGSSGHEDWTPAAAPFKSHISPLHAAQGLIGLYILWSFASSRWSSAPWMAVGASALVSIPCLWALAVGNGLTKSAASTAARALVGVCAVTGGVSIWYHYGRNPTLRADFPVGNPTFLAACLMPGILLAICGIAAQIARLRRDEPIALALVIGNAVALVLCGWACLLAGSRGAYVGLGCGVLAIGFLAAPPNRRWAVGVLATAIACVGAWYFYQSAAAFSPTGRDLTLRLRLYAWSYAWSMFTEKPFLGYGQAAFSRLGDARAVDDVLADPLVFESRLGHAHNEWIEVLADLGAVGIVLVGASLLLTFEAGRAAASRAESQNQWVVIGLLASLTAFMAEESFGVGLRTSAVPIVFFAVIGLLWASSADQGGAIPPRLVCTRLRSLASGTACVVAAVVSAGVAYHEFGCERQAFESQQRLDRGEYEKAIAHASAATHQLHPDRSLLAWFRLAEAHLAAAESVAERAADRLRRATEEDTTNPRLPALANEDLGQADAHCELGSLALKQLLERSPGFFQHGILEYRIHLTRARTAAARGDMAKQTAFLASAASAIQRELARQPFDPDVALDHLLVAGPALTLEQVMETLARPLRHHAISDRYLQFLRRIHSEDGFQARWSSLVDEAKRAIVDQRAVISLPTEAVAWAPEMLRLAAALLYLQGDYAAARHLLESAVPAYDDLAERAAVGAASAYAELAICRFFHNPTDPSSAIAAADRALALAPVSRVGRNLRRGVKSRMVTYYLAADDEEKALRLLEETAPSRRSRESVQLELGTRYSGLVDSVLRVEGEDEVLRRPLPAISERVEQWLARALTLNPDDPRGYYLAAELSVSADRDADAVAQLRKGIQKGVPPEHAERIVLSALELRPKSKPLAELAAELRLQVTAPPERTPGDPNVEPQAPRDRSGP